MTTADGYPADPHRGPLKMSQHAIMKASQGSRIDNFMEVVIQQVDKQSLDDYSMSTT